MIDTKRKGHKYLCENCGKRTKHIPAGTIEKETISKGEYGKITTGKVIWFMCIECEDTKLIDRW